jgi:6-phosphofructokinase 2
LKVKIVTLTLNPALDKSSSVERLVPEQKLRCSALQLDAGGGGINVSKGIRKLGGNSTAVFPTGGATGLRLQSILENAGIETRVHVVSSETRENFSVTETSTNIQYRFTMPGVELSESQADVLLSIVAQLHPGYLVASGSLPPGLPETYYEKVAAFAKQINARFILDTSGAALAAAADEGLYLLKPNLAELSALAGVEKLEMNQVDDAALDIIRQGKCEVVVVSLGPQGALLVTRDGFEHIPAPPSQKRSTVGAGDSMVAGMVWALSEGKSFREMAQTGVACGTAATMNPGTELFHAADVERLLGWIREYGERYRFKDF